MVKRNKTLRKELLSTIKINIKRYVSLIAIIFLGVAFYVGMGINARVLQNTMSKFFDEYNYSDIIISSIFGLTNKELEELEKSLPEIERLEGKYYVESIVQLKDTNKKNQEKVVAIHSYNSNDKINISEIVSGRKIENTNEMLADFTLAELGYKLGDKIELNDETINKQEYTIVGFIKNPQYISVNKGSSNLLNGRIDYFVYISLENFVQKDMYNVAEITLKNKYKPFSEEYINYSESIKEKITEKANEISAERKNNIIEEKTKLLSDIENQYNQKKVEVEVELEEGSKKLLQAEEEIKKAEDNLMTDEEIDELTSALKLKLDSLKLELDVLRQTIDVSKKRDVFNTNQDNIHSLEIKYNELSTEYNQTSYQYNEALGLKQKMADARVTIPQKKEELKAAKKTYEESKKTAYEELDKNYKKIQENKRALENLKAYGWNVYNRSDSYGYGNYLDDTKRIDNLSKILPLIFFIVASLVTMTSVTRMIQEERKKIGILKSLGYNKKQINSKYFKYTITAAIIGLTFGIVVGIFLFPLVFSKIYSILYFIPKIVYEIPYKEAFVTSILAFASSTLVAYIIVTKSTTEMPAMLMHKKTFQNYKIASNPSSMKILKDLAPEKRIAYRNIILNPGRSFMTAIGVAGCTALIVTSFGFRSSLRKIVDLQFKHIIDMSAQFFYKPTLTQYDINEDYLAVTDMSEVESASLNRVELTSVHANNKTYDVRTIIPEEVEKFNQNIHLTSTITKDMIDLSNLDGVVVTETLAKSANLKKSDIITFVDGSNISHTAKVSDITENYAYHYIYMNKDTYKKIYGYESLDNAIYIKYKDENNDKKINNKINSRNMYSFYNSMSTTKRETKLILGRFDAILYVILISAGLLAFIVLYNFAKINIGERLTEVATLKVLGYDADEVNIYINYEIRILTIIGIFIGLFFGYFLTNAVIKTCEVDSALTFYKGVSVISYIMGIILTILFSIIINKFVKKDLKKISMTESLKEAD
ncbi:MAG: ABC transporter permease [Bacilli bacterium]|nr:ABC transporter permease [Bacilli bacterium]